MVGTRWTGSAMLAAQRANAARWAGTAAAVLLFGACGPCGGTSSSLSSSNSGCGHPGVCLTLNGPLSGSTSGVVEQPDCIPGDGLDAVFTTHVGGHETSIEILVTDNSATSSPGFRAGRFQVKTRGGAVQGTGYASLWVKPDSDVAGNAGGWSTDGAGSSGSVDLRADESGTVHDVAVAPVARSGAVLHVSGTFNCR
jgi:hypothetical protein